MTIIDLAEYRRKKEQAKAERDPRKSYDMAQQRMARMATRELVVPKHPLILRRAEDATDPE
jgi:hypothetical protein